ncbi:hypothetical protein HETIRDRAFT_421763 [Heterobasidion irregulare TC 32-1]|uniref:Uncharacterized protein n=1 Tax=Heterobasidion irregulare (strain TC 32-1) TaxID=747525 RepID=W4JX47_HETIT|nr:uncharacterized protein HETIRDRAFT_421763 [Heterobasidion irregulare TC 32-1]ETW77655.1 hypothetical protein HETIRDRAFT_421763 [Heterobasidion irregulare TC 32-1]
MSSTVASQLTSSSLTTTSSPASGTFDATFATFTPPAPSSALPDPGSIGAGGQTGSDSGFSSSLYPTLVLLLTVSATIVFRSTLLRRRQRTAILAAIANGTYVPPSPPSRANQSVFGEKPRMYEVFLDEDKARSQKWASLAVFVLCRFIIADLCDLGGSSSWNITFNNPVDHLKYTCRDESIGRENEAVPQVHHARLPPMEALAPIRGPFVFYRVHTA